MRKTRTVPPLPPPPLGGVVVVDPEPVVVVVGFVLPVPLPTVMSDEPLEK